YYAINSVLNKVLFSLYSIAVYAILPDTETMNFYELRQFISLSNTLHFAKTSRECNISPSALSRAIQRMEDEVGRKLFIRDNRKVQLSSAGIEFKSFALDTMDRWAKYRDAVQEEEKILQGEINLYCSVTAAYGVLAGLFERFRKLHPRIHIRLQTGDAANAIEKVQAGTADLTVAAKPETIPKNLLFKTITVTPLVFIGPKVSCEVAAMLDRNPQDLRQVPMILAEQAISRKRVEAWFKEKGIKPNVYAEVAGHEAILSMVRLGCGAGVVPKLVIENSLFQDEIRILGLKPALEPYEVGLCVHKRRMDSPIVRAFWDCASPV
ncbi:MAG: HTH-type transcriptional activator IlvY, partial [Spirochaetales bacterium]